MKNPPLPDEKSSGAKKIMTRWYLSSKFSTILDGLKTGYLENNNAKFLTVPYVITCAAALECRVNDALIDYALQKWDENNYKKIADAWLSMSLPTKLDMVVPILTNDTFRMNYENEIYKTLSTLIKVRNKVVHAKSFLQEVDYVPSPFPGSMMRALPADYHEKVDDISLGAADEYTPLDFHEALNKFDRYFFQRCPDRLTHIAMVVANTEAKLKAQVVMQKAL